MSEAELPYGDIRLVFSDLDGTLYPGAHEPEPKAEKKGLMANMTQVELLEAAGIPVLPATGNNLQLAQLKMNDPATGKPMRDLATSPGIYCNGALVLGNGGAEVLVKSLDDFVPHFVKCWFDDATAPPSPGAKCAIGIGKSKLYFLDDPRHAAAAPGDTSGRSVGTAFAELMMIGDCTEWFAPADFAKESGNILSFIVCLPTGEQDPELKRMQQWLHTNDLLHFDDPAGRLSGGQADGTGSSVQAVVSKHVHVPGIGPEIDISPENVNKGSAILHLMADTMRHLGVTCSADGSEVAVFGDAGNDVELFGMKRSKAGTELEPLGIGFRPAIRVSMPWANDPLLLRDANVVTTVDVVLAKILSAANKNE